MSSELHSNRIETKCLYLHVDLDNTLLRTDLLHELLIRMAFWKPMRLLEAALYLPRGKAQFKEFVAQETDVESIELPFDDEVLEWLRRNSSKFNSTHLITASPQAWADYIQRRCPLFASAHGSLPSVNLSGGSKLEFIQKTFPGEFVYVADSPTDLAVWKEARGAVVVGSASVLDKCRNLTNILGFFERRVSIKVLIKALRVHQWAKNLLLFLPMLLAHQWSIGAIWLNAIIAFFSFSLTASSVYLFNDLADLDNDRRHSRKRLRPLAAGDLSISLGIVLALFAIIGGFSLAALLSAEFFVVLASYFAITTLYSFYLKRQVLIDVITLSCLYSVRVLAGGVATNTSITHWLLAFSTFFFLSLALMKRFTEIQEKAAKGVDLNKKISGRGYFAEDLNIILGLGLGAGMISILIFTLYLNDPSVSVRYLHVELLWTSALLLLYWIGRAWLIAGRGQMHDDPVIFASRDRVSWVVMILIVVSTFFAIGAIVPR